MIGRLQRRVLSEPELAACFLGGAHGRHSEDDYSDVDVVLVFETDAARDRAWHDRYAFAKSVMPYVPLKAFDATHIRPYFYVTLFANGTKLDYRYDSIESLRPSAADARIRILKDTPQRWAEQHQRASGQQVAAGRAINNDELNAIDQAFWVRLWNILRVLARGDSGKPFQSYMRLLFTTLPPLLAALPADDPAHQDLVAAYYSRDAAATTKHLAGLLDAYLAARSAVIRRHHLAPIDDRAFEAEIQRNIQRLMSAE